MMKLFLTFFVILCSINLSKQFRAPIANSRLVHRTTGALNAVKSSNQKILKSIINYPIKATVAAISTVKDGFYAISDIITSTPAVIETARDMLNVSIIDPFEQGDDGLTMFERNQIQLNKAMKKFLPQTYIRQFLTFLRTIIDNYYDFEDRKGSLGKQKISSTIPTYIYEGDRGSEKLSWFEQLKESFYQAVDGMTFAMETTQNIASTTIKLTQNTISAINNLPATIEDIKSKTTAKYDSLQNSLSKFKDSSIEFGVVVWKILTLEAAKETYLELQDNIVRTKKRIQSAYNKFSSLISRESSFDPKETISKSRFSAQKPESAALKAHVELQPKPSIVDNVKTAIQFTVQATVAVGNGYKWLVSKRKDRLQNTTSLQTQLSTIQASFKSSSSPVQHSSAQASSTSSSILVHPSTVQASTAISSTVVPATNDSTSDSTTLFTSPIILNEMSTAISEAAVEFEPELESESRRVYWPRTQNVPESVEKAH